MFCPVVVKKKSKNLLGYLTFYYFDCCIYITYFNHIIFLTYHINLLAGPHLGYLREAGSMVGPDDDTEAEVLLPGNRRGPRGPQTTIPPDRRSWRTTSESCLIYLKRAQSSSESHWTV
jgi:hypothetical protein